MPTTPPRSAAAPSIDLANPHQRNQFVITIDDADTAAQLTNQLLARGRKGP